MSDAHLTLRQQAIIRDVVQSIVGVLLAQREEQVYRQSEVIAAGSGALTPRQRAVLTEAAARCGAVRLLELAPLPWSTNLNRQDGGVYDAKGALILDVHRRRGMRDAEIDIIAMMVAAAMNFGATRKAGEA